MKKNDKTRGTPRLNVVRIIGERNDAEEAEIQEQRGSLQTS
jgi:hypothetical protein